MATTKLTTNPFPLGKILPGANFASASAPLTQNLTPEFTYGDVIHIQAGSGNTGNIYICNTAAAPDTTSYLNVIQVLGALDSWDNTSPAMNTVSINQVFIGSDNSSNFAIVVLRVR